jgi:hypothetical protein
LIVIGLTVTLMLSPAIVAGLSMMFAGRLPEPKFQPIAPFHLMPILESGRVLLTLALATKVMRTTELE